MADITIPPESLEAGARAIRTFYSDEPLAVCDGVAYKAARAAFVAMVEAWPGIKLENLCGWVMDGPDLPYVEETASIILPLTEASDE